jgi:flagellar biosynthetic protein FliQ
MEIMMGQLGKGIGLILFLSLPAVLLAAAIGLVVGILQAVTQVQEQTIAAAPKITFVFLLIIFGGPLMINMLEEFLIESVKIGVEVIPRQELNLLPPKPYYYGEYPTKRDQKDIFFKEEKHHWTPDNVKTMMSQPPGGPAMDALKHEPGMTNHTKISPKTSVAEKIYLKRRASGNLPEPPNKNQ